MGIKFLCHACNRKLNVKTFLAGKRGVCPHCGIGVDIPLNSQSTAGATPKNAPAGLHEPQGAANLEQSASLGQTANSGQVAMPQENQAPMAVPATAAPAMATTAPAAVAAPAVATPSQPANGQVAMPTQAPVPMPTHAPLPTHAATTAPVTSGPPASSPVPPAAPAQPAGTDVLSEAPNAVWYVRPPSGGQYGPARGDVMKKWIAEGRVSADSLIWREGWPDWQLAAPLFPSLSKPSSKNELLPYCA